MTSPSLEQNRPVSRLFLQSIGLETFHHVLKLQDKKIPFPFRHTVAGIAGFGSILFPAGVRRIMEGERYEVALLKAIPSDLPNFAIHAVILSSLLNLVPRSAVDNLLGLNLSGPFAASALFGAKFIANAVTHSVLNLLDSPNRNLS